MLSVFAVVGTLSAADSQTEHPILWSSNETIAEMLPGKKITELARKRVLSRLGGFSNIIEI